MDGYAVISTDTRGASRDTPIRLEVIGEVQAGGSALGKKVAAGTAIRIMTGAPVPEGADSVIQFEETREEGGIVSIFKEARQYQNYRFAGENIQNGDQVLCSGDRLSAADVGILSSLNHREVKVYRQPTVSIISTGDELINVGESAKPGRIRDVNGYALSSEIVKVNALPSYLGIARDTFDDTRALFLKALSSDVVISTGGVSMGRYDFVKAVYADLNVEIQFKRVNVKPGKPCTFGKKGGQLFFGLPGNPVSTLTSYTQFVRPALLRLMGARRIKKPVVHAFLEEDIRKKPGSVHLLRGCFTIKNGRFYVSTTGSQKSSVLRSMSGANCLIVIPADTTTINAGDTVAIQLIEHGEIE